MNLSFASLRVACAAALLSGMSLSAQAGLGGPVDASLSPGGGAAPAAQSKAQTSSAGTSGGASAGSSAYTVQTLQSDAGTTVQEYASANGTVFCVTWQGPRIPDLQQLFGSYYQTYVDHLEARRARGIRGPVALRGDALVVDSLGRTGNFRGRAYVPSLVPAGVNIEDLQ